MVQRFVSPHLFMQFISRHFVQRLRPKKTASEDHVQWHLLAFYMMHEIF